jgi:hypothetical protein
MGIEYQDMRAILRVLPKEELKPSSKLLILGDAIIHFSINALQQLAMEEKVKLHTIPDELTPYTLGQSLGFAQVDTLDINGKASINLDLQDQLPTELIGKYDFVIDAGVLFWCFEPGTVLKNIFRLAKANGTIFHITALSGYFGRGYYNIHPRLFEDFYLTNKCVFLQASFRTKSKSTRLQHFFDVVRSRMGMPNRRDKNEACYFRSAGGIYLAQVRNNHISFANSLPRSEADMIPNNVVSTFSCRKTHTIEPSGPLQIC